MVFTESDPEEPRHGRGEDFVPQQRAGERQDSLHGPGDRGRAGAGGEHAVAGVDGQQLQKIRCRSRNYH